MPVLEAPDTPGSDQLVAPWVDGGQGDGPLAPPPVAPDPTQPDLTLPAPPTPYASSAAGALFPPTVEAWRTTAQKYFQPDDVNKALYVIQKESGGDPTIMNTDWQQNGKSPGLFQITESNARAAGIDPTDPDQAFQWASKQVYDHGWSDWGEGTHYNGRNFGALGTPSAYGPGGTGVGSPADPGDGTNFGLPFSQPASGATTTALPADAEHYGAIARAMSIINGRANPESSADPGLLASPAIYPLSPQQMQQQAQTQDDITKAHDTYQHLVDTQVMTPDQAQAAYDAVVKQLTTEKGPNVLQALFSLAASIAANRLPGGDKTPRTTQTGSGLDIFSDISSTLGIGAGQQSNGPLQQNVDVGGAGRIMAGFQQAREASRIPFVTPAIEDYVKPIVSKAIDMGLLPGLSALEHLVAPGAPTVGKVASDQLPSTGLDFALLAAMDPEATAAGGKALVGAGIKGGAEVVGRGAEAIGGDVAARVGSSSAVDRVLSPDVLAAERKGANFAEAMGGSRYEGAQVGQSWNKKFDYLGLGEPNIAGGADVPENAPKFYRGTTSDAEPGLKPGTWVTDSRDAADRYADLAVSEAKAQGRDVTPVVSEVSVSPDQLQESHAVTGGKAYQVKAAEPTQEPIGTFPAAVKQVDKLTPNATSAGQSHGWLTPDGQTQQIVDPKIEHKDTLTGGSTGDKLGDALNEGWARIGMFGRSEHYVEADLSNPQVANRVRTYLANNIKRGQTIVMENANTGPHGFEGWGGTAEQWAAEGMPVRGGPLISKTAAPAAIGDESLKSVIATAKARSLKDMQTIATNRGVDIEGAKTKADIVDRMQAHVDGEPPYKPGGNTRPLEAQAKESRFAKPPRPPMETRPPAGRSRMTSRKVGDSVHPGSLGGFSMTGAKFGTEAGDDALRETENFASREKAANARREFTSAQGMLPRYGAMEGSELDLSQLETGLDKRVADAETAMQDLPKTGKRYSDAARELGRLQAQRDFRDISMAAPDAGAALDEMAGRLEDAMDAHRDIERSVRQIAYEAELDRLWNEPALVPEGHNAALAAEMPEAKPETVKRPDLFGNVTDTFATEGELNGYRPEQGTLLDAPTAAKPTPAGQASLVEPPAPPAPPANVPPAEPPTSGHPPKDPLDSAINKLLKAAREETNLRRVGTVGREIRAGRSEQLGGVASTMRRGQSIEDAGRLAQEAARVGRLRQTPINPVNLTAAEQVALNDHLVLLANEGQISTPDYMSFIWPLDSRSPGILAKLQSDFPTLQPAEVDRIRNVFGPEIADGLEALSDRAKASDPAKAKKVVEPSDAQLRAEADKAEALSVAQAQKEQRAAELKAQDATHKAALTQDERDRVAAERAIDRANRAAIRADQARADAQRAEADKSWVEFNKAEDAYVAAQKKAAADAKTAAIRAAEAEATADYDAAQREIANVRAGIASDEAAAIRAKEAAVREAERQAARDYAANQREIAKVRHDAIAAAEKLAQDDLTTARNWTAAKAAQNARQAASDDVVAMLNGEPLPPSKRPALWPTTPEQSAFISDALYARAAEFFQDLSPEDEAAASLAWRMIQHQLDGNQLMLEKLTTPGAYGRALWGIRAAFTGDLKDPFLNLLQRRMDALEGALNVMGMDPKISEKITGYLRDAQILEHFPDGVPTEITKALNEMHEAPREDSFGGAIDKAIARVKNTIFGFDVAVFGVHVKSAVDRGGITGMIGVVNEMTALMGHPLAELYSAEVNIPDMLRDILDGARPGTTPSAVTTSRGTVFSYGLERMGVPGEFIDSGLNHIIDWSNEHAFGNIMNATRNINYKGNLLALHMTGFDIEDPSVRYTAMQYAQATSNFADTALNTSRRNIERRLLNAPSMLRGEVANVLQMSKFFRPGSTGPERVLAATLIVSRLTSTLVIGALVASVIGVGAYEMDPTKPGFGQITTMFKDHEGRNIVISIFPQESLVRAFIKAIDVLAEKQDVGAAANDLARPFIGRASILGTIAAESVGTGYDAQGHFHTGDLGKGKSTGQQMYEDFKRAVLPPGVSEFTQSQDLAHSLLSAGGLQNFAESTSALKTRLGEETYHRAWADLTPEEQDEISKRPEVTKSADTFTPPDYKAAFARAKTKYDAEEQDDLQHWRTSTLDDTMPHKWGDLSKERQAAGEQAQGDFAKELGGIPVSRLSNITNPYYDLANDAKFHDPQTGALDYDALAAARQGYIDGLSTVSKHGAPSDQELMQSWLRKVEGDKTPEHAEYDRYIATKKAAGFFDPNLSAAQKKALEENNPQIEADTWKWNGGVLPQPGKNDVTPTAHSAAAVNIELGMQGDFPNRPIKLNGMERPVNENDTEGSTHSGTVGAWQQYGQRAADFVQGYPNDAEFNARRAARQEGEATHLYQKPFAQLTDNEKQNVRSNLTSGIKTEVLLDSPDLGAYLAWSGVEKSIYGGRDGPTKMALDSLRQRFGLEPVFKNGEPIRYR